MRREREVLDDDTDHDVVLDSETSMIYAFMAQEELSYHGGMSRGYFSVTLASDGSVEEGEVIGGEDHTGFFIAKGWAMWISWGLLGFVLIATHRYYHHYWKVAFNIHAISSWIMNIFTVVFSVRAF